MQLSLAIIGDHLPESCCPRYVWNNDIPLAFGRPRLYEPGNAPEPGKLYIAYAHWIPKALSATGSAFICAGDHIPQEAAASGNQFLLLANIPGLPQLLNMIQEIYDRFDALDNAIVSEIAKGQACEIIQIVKYGSEMLENPLFITDSTLNIIYGSKILYENGIAKFDAHDSSSPFTLESYLRIKDACISERELKTPYISNVMNDDNDRVYCYNLRFRDVFVGCAWFSETNRKFRNSDSHLAEHFFNRLQQAVLIHLPGTNQMNDALYHLLGHHAPYSDGNKHFHLHPGECWVLFRLKELAGRSSIPKDYMLAALDTLAEITGHLTIFNNDIVGLLRLPDDDSVGENEVFDQVRSILRHMEYRCGMSNAFDDIAQLDYAYLEAGFALEQPYSGDGGNISFFMDCQFEFMLSRIGGELPLPELYSRNLQRLCEYDQKHNSSYLKTLNVYLKTEMNATRSAKILFLHRGSFLKRLEKIKALLDDDLNDPKKRVYYRLIFSLLEAGFGNDIAPEFN